MCYPSGCMEMYQLFMYWISAELLFFLRYVAACRASQHTHQFAYSLAWWCVGLLSGEWLRCVMVLAGMLPMEERPWLFWLGEHTPFVLFWYDVVSRWMRKVICKVAGRG